MSPIGMNDVKVALSNLEYGVLFATLLFGATIIQTYHVLVSDSGNTRWLKPLVTTICVIETVHTVLLWIYIHYLTITEFGSPVAILVDHWSYDLSFMMFALSREPIRAFFTYRIYVLSNRRKALCILLWVLELVNGGLTLAIAYTAYASKTIFVFIARWSWLVSSAVILAVVIDVANTGCLCWYMYKTSDGLEGMRTVSRKVIVYTLETGLATCAVALATLFLWYLQPNTGLWAATSMVYSKLYSNALLACLGTRERLRQHLASDLSEASDRRNTLRLGVNAPRARTPRDLHDDLEGDEDCYPMSTPVPSKRGSSLTDMSTLVTD